MVTNSAPTELPQTDISVGLQVPLSATSLRGGILYLFQFNVLVFVIRLVTSAIIARTLGPAAMGVWLLLSLLPTYAEGFGRVKADLAAVYVLGRGKWSIGEVAWALNVIALISSGLCGLVLLAGESIIVPWLFGTDTVRHSLYLLTIITIPAHFVTMGYAYLLLHLENVGAYNVQGFLRSALPGMIASGLMLTTDLKVEAMVASILVGTFLALAYAAWTVHRAAPLTRPRETGLYSELLNFGRRLYLAGVVEHLNTYLASLIVGVRMTAAELSYFRMGQDRLQILDQIPSAVNTLLYPRLTKMLGRDTQIDLLARSMRTLVLILFVSSVVGALLAPAAVWVLYGREFMPVVWSVWLLLPGVYALGATSPATQYFMGAGRPDLVWKVALIPLVIQSAILLPLISQGGFKGAAISVSISFVAHSIVRLLVLARITQRSVSSFALPTRDDRAFVMGFVGERLVNTFGMQHRNKIEGTTGDT